MAPVVSIVVPVRNVAQTLARQLDALASQTFDGEFEVVVADNGSTDETAGVAAAWSERLPVRIADASRRRGISHARNAGVRDARAPLVLFCDGDDRVSPQWIAGMVRGLESYDVVGGPVRVVGSPIAVQWRGGRQEDRLPVACDFLPHAMGANMGFRRTVFDAIGGFDEKYLSAGDDVEFCWRAQLQGFSIGMAPGAFVDYELRQTLRAIARQFYGYGQSTALLHRDFRQLGLRPRPLRVVAKHWWRLVRTLPAAARSPVARGRWTRRAAMILGRTRGSLRYRVVAL